MIKNWPTIELLFVCLFTLGLMMIIEKVVSWHHDSNEPFLHKFEVTFSIIIGVTLLRTYVFQFLLLFLMHALFFFCKFRKISRTHFIFWIVGMLSDNFYAYCYNHRRNEFRISNRIPYEKPSRINLNSIPV